MSPRLSVMGVRVCGGERWGVGRGHHCQTTHRAQRPMKHDDALPAARNMNKTKIIVNRYILLINTYNKHMYNTCHAHENKLALAYRYSSNSTVLVLVQCSGTWLKWSHIVGKKKQKTSSCNGEVATVKRCIMYMYVGLPLGA